MSFKMQVSSMITVTQRLADLALEIQNNIANVDDETLEQVNELINQRAKLIEDIEPSLKYNTSVLDEETDQLMQSLQLLNNKAEQSLQHIYLEMGQRIGQINQGKRISKTYRDQYENTSVDGFYIDRRK